MSQLPRTTTTYYLQPGGTYSSTSTGAVGEEPVLIGVVDAVCLDDLDANGNETTSDLQGLSQDVYHLLLEAHGSNLDDPARGVGLDDLLSRPTISLSAAASVIDSQLRRDPRIDSSKTTLSVVAGVWTIAVQLVVNGALLPLGFKYSSSAGLLRST